jgi:hypothetical protein
MEAEAATFLAMLNSFSKLRRGVGLLPCWGWQGSRGLYAGGVDGDCDVKDDGEEYATANDDNADHSERDEGFGQDSNDIIGKTRHRGDDMGDVARYDADNDGDVTEDDDDDFWKVTEDNDDGFGDVTEDDDDDFGDLIEDDADDVVDEES